MDAPRIVAVLVLYRREAEQSEAFVSLRSIVEAVPEASARLHLLVYDNSPEPHTMPPLALPLTYEHDRANEGLVPAYNAGLRLAEGRGAEWLLLLDQDTALHEAYFREVLAFVEKQRHSDNHGVVAAVPQLMDGTKIVSPNRLPRLRHGYVRGPSGAIAAEPVTAFNSGAVLRVAAMRSIGGFPGEFTLDFLDHAVFHDLQRRGGRVWRLRATISHRLSTSALGSDMPADRYRGMLRNERIFYRSKASSAERAWYRLRLVRRALRHMLMTDRKFALLEVRSLLGLPL